MKEEIYQMIEARGGVSFAELVRIDGFRKEPESGKIAIYHIKNHGHK